MSRLAHAEKSTLKLYEEPDKCLSELLAAATGSRAALQNASKKIKSIQTDSSRTSAVPDQIRSVRQDVSDRREKSADLDPADRAELLRLLASLEERAEALERKHASFLTRLESTNRLLESWMLIHDAWSALGGETDAATATTRLVTREMEKRGLNAPPVPSQSVTAGKSRIPATAAPQPQPDLQQGTSPNSKPAPQKVPEGFQGVFLQDLTDALPKEFNEASSGGALVTGVQTGTPASKAGLREHDLITSLNGKKVENVRDLNLQISGTPLGAVFALQVMRSRKLLTLWVQVPPEITEQLAKKPERAGSPPSLPDPDVFDGVSVRDLHESNRQKFKIPANIAGALVTLVKPESIAASSGLRTGDVIQEIRRRPVTSAGEAAKLIGELRKEGQVLLKVYSGNTSRMVGLGQTPEAAPLGNEATPAPTPGPKPVTGGQALASTHLFPSMTTEAATIREFYQGIDDRDIRLVTGCLAESVDYYDQGELTKNKILEHIKGDWGRYRDTSNRVSNIVQSADGSWSFLLEYRLWEGDLPRTGLLKVSARLSFGARPKIYFIKASVIRAR